MNKTKLIFLINGIFCLVLSLALVGFFYSKDFFTIPKYTGDEYSKNVIVINVGGVNKADYKRFSELTEISKLIANGAYTSDVTSVAPIRTLTSNAALLTGTYADKNGIANETSFNAANPTTGRTRYSSFTDLKAPTIFDKAAENHLKTASIMMPLTDGAQITYNLPKLEIKSGEKKLDKRLKYGTPSYVLDLAMRLNIYDKGNKQPYLDRYSAKVAADTIVNKRPNLLFVNLSSVEDARRLYGVSSPEADQSFDDLNSNIKEIMQAVKDAGLTGKATVLLTTTNSLRDINTEVYINNFMANAKLILQKDDSFRWRVYAEDAGELAFVRTEFEQVNEYAIGLFMDAMKDPQNGINRIITREGLDKLNVSKDFAFALQASEGFAFRENISEENVEKLAADECYTTDGCSPTNENNNGILILSGSGIRKGQFSNAKIVDIAPTVAKLLGLEYYGCDGSVINSALR